MPPRTRFRSSPDTNNNGRDHPTRSRRANVITKVQSKLASPKANKRTISKIVIDKTPRTRRGLVKTKLETENECSKGIPKNSKATPTGEPLCDHNTRARRANVTKVQAKLVIDITNTPSKSLAGKKTRAKRANYRTTLQLKQKSPKISCTEAGSTSTKTPPKSKTLKASTRTSKSNVSKSIIELEGHTDSSKVSPDPKMSPVLDTLRPMRKNAMKKPSKLEDFILDSKPTTSTPVVKNARTKRTSNVKKLTTKVNSKATPEPKSVTPLTKWLDKTPRPKRTNTVKKFLSEEVSPISKTKPFAKRLLDNSLSFIVLDDRKQSKKKSDNVDIYEFTFDPNEEPQPQKKKRKRTVKKKPAKPKIGLRKIPKSSYNDNVSKAINKLKNKVNASKPQPVHIVKSKEIQNIQPVAKSVTVDIPQISIFNNTLVAPVNESAKASIHESNYASICIEDIAADFEPNDNNDDINYSPVNSPNPIIHDASEHIEDNVPPVLSKDPLNLQGDLSFFDDRPLANSSMNVSVRHPLASPWRVEFRNLPMKWPSNTYIKPNMTPAVESSFINSEDAAKKKHVYTNMLPTNDPLPEIDPPLKQMSIISFMREVAENSANKKKRRRSPSPTKANYIFDDFNYSSHESKTPKKAKKSKDSTPNSSNDKSDDKENSDQIKSVSPVKLPVQKKTDKDLTFFGFDDSENADQENVLPVKIVRNKRKGLRSRPALRDLNVQGPTRAIMAVAKAKLTSSEVVEQLYDKLKSAEDAPVVPETEVAQEPDVTVASDNQNQTNVDDPSWQMEDDDDAQSVHLFEDIEIVHHLKPHRKSYNKAKKVTFRQNSECDTRQAPELDQSSDDDLSDPGFKLPDMKQKKVIKKRKPKKMLSKKEEKEVEEWAAGFNSMCEDIDDFDLVVERD